MSCCVGETEDNLPEYIHALNTPVEVQKLFLEQVETNFSLIEIAIKGVDFAIKSNPPPRKKVYLTIHQLIFYA
jgi:hypothetical protein